LHELDESLALDPAEQVRPGHLDVGEEQLAGVLAVLADLLQVPAAPEPGRCAVSTTISETPAAPAAASVFATTNTRSHRKPLEMNVFEPFRT
jgi:hypothetical protein